MIKRTVNWTQEKVQLWTNSIKISRYAQKYGLGPEELFEKAYIWAKNKGGQLTADQNGWNDHLLKAQASGTIPCWVDIYLKKEIIVKF